MTYDPQEWTKCGTELFNLSSDEVRNLRKACAAMKLSFRAQAARPANARRLLDAYKVSVAKGEL